MPGPGRRAGQAQRQRSTGPAQMNSDTEDFLRRQDALLRYELGLCQDLLISLYDHGELAPDNRIRVQLRLLKLDGILA